MAPREAPAAEAPHSEAEAGDPESPSEEEQRDPRLTPEVTARSPRTPENGVFMAKPDRDIYIHTFSENML